MTCAPDSASHALAEPRPSLLPFNPESLLEIRVLPAQFARMTGVSKQTVSQWIKRGIVTLPPDGRLNPTVAAREVIARTDPARLRARVFKAAMESHAELRERIRSLESQLAEARAVLAANDAKFVHVDRLAVLLGSLQDLIEENFGALVAAAEAGNLAGALDTFIASVFWPDAFAETAADEPLNGPEDSLP